MQLTVAATKPVAAGAEETAEQTPEKSQGVVYRITDQNITVAFDEVPSGEILDSTKIILMKLANEVTYKRYAEVCLFLLAFPVSLSLLSLVDMSVILCVSMSMLLSLLSLCV